MVKFSASDFRERLVEAERRLKEMSAQERSLSAGAGGRRVDHLDSKAEGVRLALSYFDEMTRG